MHDAPVPSWRDTGSDSVEPSGTHAWQSGGPAPTETAGLPSKRGVKRILALVFLVAFAVGIGVLLYMLRHIPPTGLVLVGSGYEKNLFLPHNVYGWNGLKKLEDASDRGGFFRGGLVNWFNQPSKVRLAGDPLELNKELDWEQAWKKIVKQIDSGPHEEKTVILAISMHGISDGNEAYLLRNVPDVQSLEAFNQSRIKFRDVLDSLTKLKNKDIVLLLDVCHVQSHWPIGMLQNDFVATLKRNYEKDIAALGNVTVICSTSPDQISWASEELQTTLFGHYVVKALAGAGRPDNENVTAATLFKYVADNVSMRAKIERAREQVPMLLGGDADVSLVHVETTPSEKPAEPRPLADADLAALQIEWNAWKTLKTEQAPHVYCPHLWRLYQETLLRFEQLMRAGDPTGKAPGLKKDLSALAQNILDAKGLKAAYKCVGNNFPIHRVLGFHRDNEVGDDVLRGYFKSNPEDRSLVLERYGPPFGDRYVLGRLSRLIWDDKVKSGVDFDAATIRNRLLAIGKDLQLTQRPVEVQLLKMLEDADPKLDPEIIKLALRVRSSAEETALSVPATDEKGEQRTELYAEVIFQRIKDKVNNADILRREGEDLLFGNSEHARKARDKLQKAHAAYLGARAEADQMRKALALRDELAADLPFLAAWLAALPFRGDPVIEDLRTAAEALGDRLADLNRNLGAEQKVPALNVLAEMRGKFARAADRHQELCVALEIKSRAGLQQDWHDIDAVLRIPPLDVYDKTDVVKVRMGLLSGERGISGKLHVEKEASGKIDADKREDRLDRNEKMLRACLKPYVENGDLLAPGRIADHAREFFLKQPAEIKQADGSDDEKMLLAAVECCRVVPGGLVDSLKNDLTEKRINPAERLRRLRTYQLLQWLGQRTLDDHWFDTPETTYYGPAASAYFDSARSLFDKDLPKALVNDEKEVAARIAKAGLSIIKTPNPYWTSEIVFPLEWHVQADPAVPEGTPMVWFDVTPAKGGNAVRAKERDALEWWPAAKKPCPAAVRLAKNPPVNDGDIVSIHTVYRGQHVTNPLKVRRPPPDLIVHHLPARDKVEFAVRMDSGFDYGAISIVLDNSGSMKTPYPSTKSKDKDGADPSKTRYYYALKAMEEVLLKIPRGTEISFFSFGDDKTGKTTEPIKIRDPSPWKPGELNYYMELMGKISLNNDSPVAKSITMSMEKGFTPGFVRPKAVVVITDGMADNCSYFRGKENERANTAEVRKEMKKYNELYPDIDVIVVCIIDPDDEESIKDAKIAREQFEFIKSFTPKSDYIEKAKLADLGKAILDILRPRVELKLGDKAAPGFAGGRPVNFQGDSALLWRPEVPADNYQATILRTNKNTFDVKMPRGQDIFGVLKRSQNRLFLERGILAHQMEVLDVAGEVNVKAKDGWLASLLENHVSFGVRELSQLVAFEKSKLEVGVLQQTHPGFVWLELTDDKGNKASRTLVWGKEWSTPAPAFRIRTPDWPKVDPKLSAWFWPEIREDFLETDKLKLKFRDAESVNDQGPVPRATELPIESVIWEPEKELDTPTGGKQIKDCIVVRFRYPVGRPLFIDLMKEQDGPEVGAVHLYYSDAGKGTACFFGPARPTTVKLVLIDIEEFKKAAQRVEFAPRHEYKAPSIFVREFRD